MSLKQRILSLEGKAKPVQDAQEMGPGVKSVMEALRFGVSGGVDPAEDHTEGISGSSPTEVISSIAWAVTGRGDSKGQ